MGREREVPVLFDGAKDCCGCGSCTAACPRGVITMTEDARGFVFPRIDESACVGCGACVRACGLHARLGGETQGPWYAAAGRGDVSQAASGGVFSTFARDFLKRGGCVFGAAYERFEDGLHVRHRMAEDEGELRALLNSKYVQSDAGRCFPEVRAQLKRGREVLFCGTPCQVAGLKGFLGRDYSNLYTADLVCHGVPSEKLFNAYINQLQAKYGQPVVDLRFRCKRNGWGHSLLLLLLQDGTEIAVPSSDSSYYGMFLKLKTLRDSCYVCPYACGFRAGDVTLGDFWGIQRNRPDLLGDGRLDLERGVSCLLVNNERGRVLVGRSGDGLTLKEATFDDIAKGNDQLRAPSMLPRDRGAYLDAFADDGWPGIERVWNSREKGAAHLLKHAVGLLLPERLKKSIKAALRV